MPFVAALISFALFTISEISTLAAALPAVPLEPIMRIQHNISALNSWGKLGINQNNAAKNNVLCTASYLLLLECLLFFIQFATNDGDIFGCIDSKPQTIVAFDDFHDNVIADDHIFHIPEDFAKQKNITNFNRR